MTTLIDTTLYQLAIDLQQTRKEQKTLEAKEDQLKADIYKKIGDIDGDLPIYVYCDGSHDPLNNEHPLDYPCYKINPVPASRKTLDRELLLANGVAPDILGKSMSVSSYTRLDVKEDKANGSNI